MGNPKAPQIAITVLRKKVKAGGPSLPHFKASYRATVIKTVCIWHKDRYIDQWTRLESPGRNPHLHGQSSTSVPRLHNREGIVSSTSDAGKTGYPHANE